MAVVLAALMMLSIIPVAFAEEISSISADAALSVRMDDAWAAIELAKPKHLLTTFPQATLSTPFTPLLSTTKMLMQTAFPISPPMVSSLPSTECTVHTTTGSATKLKQM